MVAFAADTPPSAPTLGDASPPALPPLPALAPDDKALLLSLFRLREDFAALALETSRDLLDLYAWAASPTIAPWLAFHRHAAARADLAAALAQLRSLLDSPDPVERRRAAATLLRAHLGVPRTLARQGPCSMPAVPPTPSARSVCIAPMKPRPVPLPVARPAPGLTAAQTAQQLLDAFREASPRTVLSTLHAHAAPGAMIFGEPIPDDPAPFVFAPGPDTEQAFRKPAYASTPVLHLDHHDAPASPTSHDDAVAAEPSQDPAASAVTFCTCVQYAGHDRRALYLTLAPQPSGEWRLTRLDDKPP